MLLDIKQIKKELRKHNIPFSDNESYDELEKKLYSLSITDSQIKELAFYGITYKNSWCWNRRAASEFLKDIIAYNEYMKTLPISPYQKIIFIENGIFDFEGLTTGEAAERIYNFPPTPEQLNRINTLMIDVPDKDNLTYGRAENLIQTYVRNIFG